MQHMSSKLKYTLFLGIGNRVCLCYMSSIFLNFIEILTRDIIFMTKELVLTFSNKVVFGSVFGNVGDDSLDELENSVH